ncbi:ArsR/SmtB family transcription factor [Nocardiopsis coralliicola]
MLRIHFSEDTPEPIVRTAAPDPLWEVLLSLHTLRGDLLGPEHARWRARVADRMDPLMRRLAQLAPPVGYSPDFLTPGCGDGGLAEGLERLRSTPLARIRADLGLLAAEQGPSSAARELASGSSDALRGLERAVRSYHALAIAPGWERIARVVQGCGAGTGLPPPDTVLPDQWHWRGPILEAAYPVERDIRLCGRPLRLVPSFFCRCYPIAYVDPDRPPVLVHPVRLPPVEWPTRERRALGRLIGGTRARVLHAAVEGGTTGDLAARLGLSGAATSGHLSVLRDAGLVSSLRMRNRVRHIATARGCGLLGAVADDFTRLAEAPG